jgi:hypothetical protein
MAFEWLDIEQLLTWYFYTFPVVAVSIWAWESIWDTQYVNPVERSFWGACEGVLIGITWPVLLILFGLVYLVHTTSRATHQRKVP